MNAVGLRHTAVERREEIIQAAFDAFSETGLDGTSTETIAQRVGISQPYLFRLFGTKKELFVAAVERCLEQAHEAFRTAVEDGDPNVDVLKRLGGAYLEIVRDQRRLRMQMQAFAACDDPEVRRVVQRGFSRLIEDIQLASGASPELLAAFVAKGMLLNVMASMDVLDSDEPWAVALKEGCMGPSE
jgi:AcrR family transcriptional regulator